MSRLLVGLPQALNYLGLVESSEEEYAPALEAAIQTAQVRLAAEVTTDLEHVLGDDLFHADRSSFSGIQVAGYFRLLLTHGFLRDETVTVVATDGLSYTELEALPSTDWIVDKRLGVVHVKAVHGDKFLRVQYQSGFVDAEDLATRELWLTEALLAYVPMALAARRDTTEDNTTAQRNQGNIAQGMVQAYTRKVGFTIRPILSNWSYAPVS